MAQLHEEILELTTDDGPMAALLKQPAGDAPEGGWPTVVIFHDGPGIRPATHAFVQKLAGAGYRVAVPDLYHRKGRLIGFTPEDVAADPTIPAQMWELITTMTDANIQHDLDVTLAALDVPDGKRIGCIGFCLGARAVYRTLTRLPDLFGAGATWHPSFLADDGADSPHLGAADLSVPLYIGIGTADKLQSIEMHQPFFDAVEPLDHVEVEIFDGADHGFTWPSAPSYHQVAADGCWDKTMALFAQHLT